MDSKSNFDPPKSILNAGLAEDVGRDIGSETTDSRQDYYLIQGALIKIIQEDGSTGMAQIRAAGIKSDLWTYNKFLSRRPIKNAYAAIEPPETSGLIAGDTLTKMGGVQGATDTPTPSLHGSAGGFRNPEQLQQNLRPVFELGYR